MAWWPAFAVLMLSAFVPPVQAEGAAAPAQPTTVFLHMAGWQDMPMNTQMPPDEYSSNFGLGLATNSLDCASIPVLNTQAYHTFRGYGLQGHLDYGQDPPAQISHGYGTGLFSDLHLAGEAMTLHWYWSTSATGSTDAPAQPPIPVPHVIVHATLRAGQMLSVDNAAFDGGALIAEGESAPALLAADQSTGVSHDMVDGHHVYHFQVPMKIAQAVVPSALGYNLRVDTYVLRDGCPAGGYLTPNLLDAHTSAGHRPRLEMSVLDGLSVQVTRAAPFEGGVVVAVNASTPWGAMDIANTSISIDGPVHARSVEPIAQLQQFHCHCPPLPYQQSWFWDSGADGAPAGDYVATVTATNTQGTMTATGSMPFVLAPPKAAPSLGLPLLLVALALAAVAVRRR